MSQYDVVIVGGGISGLSALHFIKTRTPDKQVLLFEADERLGGTIGTDHVDGYSLDWGPNGFLDREPLTLQLADELGLSDQLERANENVSNRFILRGGRLRPVPMSPPKFLASDILSVKGRLRILMEPFASGPNGTEDESIYDFAARRIGREAADYLVQPMVSGVYGGLADRLSLESCFPIMKEMEAEHGSLIKAMIAKRKQARAEGKEGGGPAGPGGWLTSFRGGLNRIVERFEQLYREYIITGTGVQSITREGEFYKVTREDGAWVLTRNVVLAAPSYRAATMVDSISRPLADALASIPYAPISVICLGYPRLSVKYNLNGFGFLVPRKEDRRLLGSIWTSSIFQHRAPDGHVQFRSMVGGDGDHESIELSESELIAQVKGELSAILGIRGEPNLVKTYRWEHGIPQFRIGHRRAMEAIESHLNTVPGIYITGNAYYGIGLNDCVRQSFRVAEKLSARPESQV